jgi:hypothetical protein
MDLRFGVGAVRVRNAPGLRAGLIPVPIVVRIGSNVSTSARLARVIRTRVAVLAIVIGAADGRCIRRVTHTILCAILGLGVRDDIGAIPGVGVQDDIGVIRDGV